MHRLLASLSAASALRLNEPRSPGLGERDQQPRQVAFARPKCFKYAAADFICIHGYAFEQLGRRPNGEGATQRAGTSPAGLIALAAPQ
jgi:hypothetical protein